MATENNLLLAAEKIGSILEESGVPTVVIGAIALAAHRYIRFTQDLDLGVDADLPMMKHLAVALRNAGFDVVLHEADADDPLAGVIDIAGAFGLVQVVSFANRFPVAIHDALRDNNLRLHPGSSLKLAPIAQLVALKLYAGGHKSKADIIELLRRNPECDRDEIARTCKRYRLRGLNPILAELAEE